MLELFYVTELKVILLVISQKTVFLYLSIWFSSVYIIYIIIIIVFNVITFGTNKFFNGKLTFEDIGIVLFKKNNLTAINITYIILIGFSFLFNLIYLKLFKKKSTKKRSKRLIKKTTIQSFIIRLNENNLAYNVTCFITKILSIIFISMSNGVIIFPIIFIVFTDMILSLKSKFKLVIYKIWHYLLYFILIYTFSLLLLAYFENLNFIKITISSYYKEIVGNFVIYSVFDVMKIIVMFLLILISKYNLKLHRRYLNLLKNKDNIDQNKFTNYLKITHHENFIILFFKKISLLFIENSYKITQVCLILWGISRTSLIMFIFVLSGMIGVVIKNKYFKKYLIKILLLFGFLYILCQIIYNMSFFNLSKNALEYYEKIFYIIGIYRYENLINDKLVITNYKVEKIEIIRMYGLLFDLLSYVTLHLLYLILKEKKEAEEIEMSVSQIDQYRDTSISYFNYYLLIITNYLKLSLFNNIKFIFMFSLLFISIIKFDWVHFVYLIFFIIIFYNYNIKKNEVFISISLYYSGLIILILYIFRYLPLDINKNILSIIGINNVDNKFYYYFDNVIIFLFCYFIKTEKNSEYNNYSVLFKMNKNEEEIYEQNEKNYKVLVDFLKFILIDHFIYLDFFGLLFFIYFRSYNVVALIFLLFFIYLFTIKIFKGDDIIFKVKFNQYLFKFFNIFLIIILVLRYFCYFDLKIFNVLINKIVFYLRLFIGYNTDFSHLLIFSAGLLFFIFSIHSKIFDNEDYLRTHEEYKSKINITESNPKKFKYYLYCIYIVYKLLENKLYPLFYIFIVFLLSLFIESLIGILFLVILMINIIKDRDNSWSNIWFFIYFFASFCLFFQYILNLFYYTKNEWINNYFEFIGFHSKGEKLLLNIISNLLIMIFSLKFKLVNNYKVHILDEKKLKRKIIHYEKKEYSKYYDEYIKYINNDNINVMDSNIVTDLKENIEYYKLYIIDLPILTTNRIIFKLKVVFNYFINELAIIMIFLSAFYAINTFSFILISFGIYFYFKIKYLYDKNYGVDKIKKYMTIWIIFAIIFSVYSLYNYFWNIYEFSFLRNKLNLKLHLFCDESKDNIFSSLKEFKNTSDYKNCVETWSKFFNIKSYGMKSLILDFTTLLFLIFSMIRQTDYLNKSENVEAEELLKKQDNLTNYILILFYQYFPSLCLIVFFFIGIINDTGDIISILYFLISIFLLINSSIYKKKSKFKLFKFLEIFNIVLVTSFFVFQIPTFKCPILNKERYFYSKEECIFSINSQNEIYKFENSSSKTFSFYVVFINTIGLKKVIGFLFFHFSKLTFMLLFLFFGMIQKHIWKEKEYLLIDKKFRDDKKYIFMQTINYIICFFEKKIWKYQKKQIQNKLLKRKQKVIDQKIISWEKILKNKTEIQDKNEEKSEHSMEEKNLLEMNDYDNEDENKNTEKKIEINENLTKITDLIILNFKDNEPILSLDEIEKIVVKNENNHYEIYKNIKQEQENKRIKYINYIINLKELNILETISEIKKYNLNEIIDNPDYKYLFKNEINNDTSIINKSETGSSHKSDSIDLENINNLIDIKQANLKWDFKIIFVKYFNMLKDFLILFIDKAFVINHNKYQLDENTSLIKIIELLLKSYTLVYIGICFFFNVLFNTNLLSIFLLFTYLVYAAIEYPFPHKNYFKFCIYYLFIILLIKMIYQTPLFCGNPEFTLIFSSSCKFEFINENYIYKRWDVFLGINKFYGYASIPKNKGVFLGILGDFLCLIFLLIHRWNLKKSGLWNNLNFNDNNRIFPQLNISYIKEKLKFLHNIKTNNTISNEDIDDNKSGESDVINENKEVKGTNLLSNLNNNNDSDDDENNFSSNISTKKKKKNIILKYFFNYYYKMFPYFNKIPKMKSTYNNDKDYNNPLEKIKYEPLFIKNGIEIYTYLVVFEILILVFFMFFYSNLNGSSVTFKQGLDKSRFSGNLVLTIIFIIIIICFNRISYKQKFIKYNHEIKIIEEKIVTKKYHENSFMKKISLFLRYLLHIILIIFIFDYLFIKVTYYNRKWFENNLVAQLCFVLIFIYFFLNAIQIKYGYTDSMKIHAFTEKSNLFNRVGVRVFKLWPFIYEIKNVIDWTITKTSLDLFQWFKLEDAYVILFLCKNQMKVRLKKKFGEPIFLSYKIFMGWCFIFFLIGIIVLPMLLFSTLNPNYILNNPLTGSYNLELWTNLKDNNIKKFKIFEIQNLLFNKINKKEYDILLKKEIEANIEKKQIQKVVISTYSENLWNISPPNYQNLLKLLKFNLTDFYLTASWSLNRNLPAGSEISHGSNTIPLSKEDIKNIYDILNGESKSNELIIEYWNPSLIKLNSKSYNNINISQNINNLINNSKIKLKYYNTKDGKYWQILNSNNENINFFLVNELIIGNFFGTSFINIGIIGFYVTIVFAIGKLIRSIFDQIIMKVIYEEMPNTDDLIDFCDSIYLSRKEGDLRREQKLYDLLIRIYRSPEILLQLTNNFLEYDNIDKKNN